MPRSISGRSGRARSQGPIGEGERGAASFPLQKWDPMGAVIVILGVAVAVLVVGSCWYHFTTPRRVAAAVRAQVRAELEAEREAAAALLAEALARSVGPLLESLARGCGNI